MVMAYIYCNTSWGKVKMNILGLVANVHAPLGDSCLNIPHVDSLLLQLTLSD